MPSKLLSDLAIRSAKAKAKPYRLFDGDGLALWISPTGVKSWQLRYKLDGKDQTATLGKLDRLTLSEAREKAAALRKLAGEGHHLTVAKRDAKIKRKTERANTFEIVAADWLSREARRMKWTPNYQEEARASIRNHLRELNALPIATIKATTLAPVLRAVERKAPMMVEKVRRRLDAILDYAVEHGIIVGNPFPAIRRGAKIERRHYPAVTDLAGVGEIMRAARAADPCKGVQRAHLLLAVLALRVSEIVSATWDEFDLDGVLVAVGDGKRTKRDANAGNWRVPRERMKRKDAMRGPHVVPLPPALLAALREWRKADGDDAKYVCPAPRDPEKPITPEALEKYYRNVLYLAGRHSPHSWRSAFSTICRDAGKDPDSIEAQLDHVVGTKVAAAYDRAARLELRRDLMAWYEGVLTFALDGTRKPTPPRIR